MREGQLPQTRFVAWGCVALATIIYVLRLDHNVGLMVDDSWYVLLAKSLAEGHGYQLINSPVPPTHPLYPPGYPVLLSLFWSCYPQFPANVIVLKLLSLLALAGTAKLLLHLQRQYFQLPAALNYLQTTTVLLTPLLVYYATATLLSECVFLLVQTGVIVLWHQATRERRRGWALVVAIGLLTGTAAMIRVIGLALVGAGVLAFLCQRRLRAALVVLFLGVAPLGLWEARSLSRVSLAPEERANYAANSYLAHFWRREMLNPDSATITPGQFASRVGEMVRHATADSMAELFLPLTRPKTSRLGMVASLLLSLLVALGCWQSVRTRCGLSEWYFVLSLLLILAWGFSPTRFLLVLFPLLFQYFQAGVGWCAERFRLPLVQCQMIITLLLLLGFVAVQAALLSARYELPLSARWKSQFGMLEHQRTLAELLPWIRQQIPTDEIIATDVPALVYLYTNHKTVYLLDPVKDRAMWQRLGIRHLVFSGLTTVPQPADESVSLRFTTANRKAAVYQIK